MLDISPPQQYLSIRKQTPTPIMLAENLKRLKQEWKETLLEDGAAAAITAIKNEIEPDAPKYNAILQIEARLNEANLQRVKGILSNEELQVEYNKIRNDVLTFIDDLRIEDFSKEAAKKAKMGSVLYKIPREMELKKRCKCIVRLAYEEITIIQNIELSEDTTIKSVRVSDSMEVNIIDPEGGTNFKVTSVSSPEQFLEDDEYSEWVFYVTPLTSGSHPIVLKVSVIELIGGKEKKKEIVMEELVTIVTEPVEEEEDFKGFKDGGYSFAFSGIAAAGGGAGGGDNDGGGAAGSKTAGKAVAKAGGSVFKKYGMVLGAFTAVIMASFAMGGLTFVRWQEALFYDTVEKYEAFMLDYPDSKYLSLAKQHRDLRVALNDNSDTLLLDMIIENPKGELVPKMVTEYEKRSGKNLTDGIKERTKEKYMRENAHKFRKKKEKIDDGDTTNYELSPIDSAELARILDSLAAANQEMVEDVEKAIEKDNDLVEETPKEAPAPPVEAPPKKEKIEDVEDASNWLEKNMVTIKGGKLTMGCDESKTEGCPTSTTPTVDLKIPEFRLCKFEVTRYLWKSVMGTIPINEVKNPNCMQCPVEGATFAEIKEFIKKLNKQSKGIKYRLPTEAEWEYVARGGESQSSSTYPGGENLDELAWHKVNSGNQSHPVGRKKPNELGIYDMAGNVMEYCEDSWSFNHEERKKKGKALVIDQFSSERIVRGGSWMAAPEDPERVFHVYGREYWNENDAGNDHVGFRLAADKK